jgi:hypothetical protein
VPSRLPQSSSQGLTTFGQWPRCTTRHGFHLPPLPYQHHKSPLGTSYTWLYAIRHCSISNPGKEESAQPPPLKADTQDAHTHSFLVK